MEKEMMANMKVKGECAAPTISGYMDYAKLTAI